MGLIRDPRAAIHTDQSPDQPLSAEAFVILRPKAISWQVAPLPEDRATLILPLPGSRKYYDLMQRKLVIRQ